MAGIQQYNTGIIQGGGVNGSASFYTDPIAGRILKVTYTSGTIVSLSGMFSINVSGTASSENIFFASGTMTTSNTWYPRTYVSTNSALGSVAGSPYHLDNKWVNGPLFIWVSGLGSPADINNIAIYHIQI